MILSKFFIFYLLLAAGIILLIVIGRKNKPSRLRMRNAQRTPVHYGQAQQDYKDLKEPVKSLDCFFMFNGHEFNAYEVLEVPAGAPIDMVEKAFKAKRQAADSSQIDFFRLAYEAICRRGK